MRTLAIALTLLAIGFMTACAATRLYEGEKLPDDQVVRIRAERPAKISQIDGKAVTGHFFEILPGEHSIELSANKTISESLLPLSVTTTCSTSLDLSAGKHYTVRSRFHRERLRKPKAPYGAVYRYELTVNLSAAGDSASLPALECSAENACLILWKLGQYNQTATCPQYEKSTFAFRRDDDAKSTPTISFLPEHCEELDDIHKPDCWLKAGDKVLAVSLTDGNTLFFFPRESATATIEQRNAAQEACEEIRQRPAIVSCLSDHGYVLQE
jgi:hypothetical protein